MLAGLRCVNEGVSCLENLGHIGRRTLKSRMGLHPFDHGGLQPLPLQYVLSG